MKKLGKVLLISVAALVVLAAVAITFTIGWRPFIGPRKRATTAGQFERTPQRIARGDNLVNHLLDCGTCHSEKDWTQHGAPQVPGKELAGQVLPIGGFPGTIVAPNLTPDFETGSGNWTDDQIARAVREGIKHDGSTLFPLMPYKEYRNLSDEDVASVVVYLRSLAPIRNMLPGSAINFPVKYLVRSAPEPLTSPVAAPSSDPLTRGKYMVTLGCGCHNAKPSLHFAGGEVLEGPWGLATSANLTPDASGINYYDETLFIKTIRSGYVGARKLSSIMPFGQLKGLTDDDLKAIFAYLHSLEPVKHHVDNALSPTYCKLCKQKHGAGEEN